VLDDQEAAALDPQLLVELGGQHAQRLLAIRQLDLQVRNCVLWMLGTARTGQPLATALAIARARSTHSCLLQSSYARRLVR